jgi:hypothetical protein
MQRLVNIAHKVRKVSGHKGSLKSDSILIGFEDIHARTNDVHRVNISLKVTHGREKIIRIIDDVDEMIGVEV